MSLETDGPFHLAIPVNDLVAARRFYGELFGCPEGRSADHWVDFDFFGHQLVCHLAPGEDGHSDDTHHNPVDGDAVPVPHFGVVLDMDRWQALADRLAGQLPKLGLSFVIEPRIRFQGEPGEQATFFLRDPAGNALEFKAFADPRRLFATDA
ncbi:MAG: VOC family protein [Xanthomonadales bacterium]|jgi:extradiol dioxygenase family protein|nr:VOC family protein [Xanthomonadales bacterium]